MRFHRSLLVAGLVALTTPCLSQSAAPQRQLSLDLTAAGLNVGYATRNSSRTSFGASIGIGGDWMNYMVLGGSHFAESNGLSYDTKDGYTSKELLELARLGVFVRTHFDQGRQLDLGLKASAFLHSDSSDDDPGGGAFIGLNATAIWWQWKRLRFGSELDVGRYAESQVSELGVNLSPLLLRITFP